MKAFKVVAKKFACTEEFDAFADDGPTRDRFVNAMANQYGSHRAVVDWDTLEIVLYVGTEGRLHGPYTVQQLALLHLFQGQSEYEPHKCKDCPDKPVLGAGWDGLVCPQCGCKQLWTHPHNFKVGGDLLWEISGK